MNGQCRAERPSPQVQDESPAPPIAPDANAEPGIVSPMTLAAPTPANPSRYVTDCDRCGARIETATPDVVCAKCGLVIRIEWQWTGEVHIEQG